MELGVTWLKAMLANRPLMHVIPGASPKEAPGLSVQIAESRNPILGTKLPPTVSVRVPSKSLTIVVCGTI